MLKTSKTGLAMAALLAGFLVMGTASEPVEAKTSINIWIGLPGLGYWNGPGYYGGVYRNRLGCQEGRRIIDHRGYNSVRAVDCGGRYFHYRGRRHGVWYILELDSRTGHIYRIRRA